MPKLPSAALAALLAAFGASGAQAQLPAPTPDRTLAQAQAMRPLAWMDGVWRGTAWAATPEGRLELTHTERVGPMIAGSLKVMEGKSYTADGKTDGGFNAFAVMSYDPDKRAYSMRSYAQGRAGDFALTLTGDGWTWAAGPVKYTAVFKDGVWSERGDYVPPGGGEPRQVFQMTLRRVSATEWPSGGAVPAR